MDFQTLTAKDVFKLNDSSFSKKFGQNYLFDENINKKIVNSTDLTGKNVLEIGPGPGGLTIEILRKNQFATFTIIEYDKIWYNFWKDATKNTNNVSVIFQDILRTDLEDLNIDTIISNLPYNISTQVLYKIFPYMHKFETLILMFQKEVADRITANLLKNNKNSTKSSKKNYAKLSILAQMFAKIDKIMDINPGSFTPAPKVKSTLLKFQPYKTAKKIPIEDFSKTTIIQDTHLAANQITAQTISQTFQKTSSTKKNPPTKETSIQIISNNLQANIPLLFPVIFKNNENYLLFYNFMNEFLTAAFATRRKFLKSNIQNFDQLFDIIINLGYSSSVRAEEIAINDYMFVACKYLSQKYPNFLN